MHYTFRHALAALAAIGMLLLCGRVGFADNAGGAATVRVKYASGDTELATLQTGVKYFGSVYLTQPGYGLMGRT